MKTACLMMLLLAAFATLLAVAKNCREHTESKTTCAQCCKSKELKSGYLRRSKFDGRTVCQCVGYNFNDVRRLKEEEARIMKQFQH